MSDTAAFIAGCAVTGVAALLLVRGDLASGQARSLPSVAAVPGVTNPTPSTAAIEDPSRGWQFENQLKEQQTASTNLTDQIKQQQSVTEDLKSQLSKQQTENETLKVELEKQQRSTEQLMVQLQEQQRFMDRMSIQDQLRPAADLSGRSDSGNWQTALLVIGGVLVVVILGGAGLLLAIVVIMSISNNNNRRRQTRTRTVHVVHPMPTPYPGAFTHSPPVLPAKSSRSRQPKHIDVDYYAD